MSNESSESTSPAILRFPDGTQLPVDGPVSPAMRDLRPVGTFIMCREIKTPDTTAGGLYLPDQSKSRSFNSGIVLECGDDVVMRLMPGSEIVFQTHAEYRVKSRASTTDAHLLFVPEASVIAVLE